MKLIIQNNRIAGTATDAYTGPDAFIDAPPDYDQTKTYEVVNGALVQAVPKAVSRFQARMAIRGAGLFDAVEAMMAAPETPVAAKEAWASAQEFERTSPTVAGMAAALGMTEAQLDALFIAAAAIKA